MSLPLLGAGPSAAGFSPLSLSPIAWFKADGITGLSDAAAVTQWDDASGNGRHVLQATAANQPLYKTAILNGLPVVRFDGSNDRLVSAAFAQPQEWTVCAVAKTTSTASLQSIVDTDSGSRHAQLLRANTAVESIAFSAAGSAFTDSETATPTNFNVLTARRDSTTVQVFVNGTSAGSTATTGTPSSVTTVFQLGCTGAGSQFLTGDIAEAIYFGSALSTTDRQRVQTYLGTKYNITVA